MHDMRIMFDSHDYRHLARSNFRHASDIVAPEIEQHQMLGQYLGVRQQIRCMGLILGPIGAAWPGTRDGSERHLVVAQTDEYFRA